MPAWKPALWTAAFKKHGLVYDNDKIESVVWPRHHLGTPSENSNRKHSTTCIYGVDSIDGQPLQAYEPGLPLSSSSSSTRVQPKLSFSSSPAKHEALNKFRDWQRRIHENGLREFNRPRFFPTGYDSELKFAKSALRIKYCQKIIEMDFTYMRQALEQQEKSNLLLINKASFDSFCALLATCIKGLQQRQGLLPDGFVRNVETWSRKFDKTFFARFK
jgi:hypothetical protein